MDSVELLRFLTKFFAVLTIVCMLSNIFFILRGSARDQNSTQPRMFLGMSLLTMTMVCGMLNEFARRTPALVQVIFFLVALFVSIFSMTVSYYALWKSRGGKKF